MTIYGSLSPDLRQQTQESIRILDMVDLDLSHYFDINVDEDGTYTIFSPKIGDIRMQDPDDSGNTDYIQFTMDPTAGAILHNTSMVTDGNVHRILASGTFNGTAATRSVNYVELDLDGITVNDAAANAVTLKGMNVDFNGLTATAVGLSSIYGLNIELPTIMSTWAGGYGVRVAENTNDMVAELVNHSGYGLYLYGDTSNSGRVWMNVTPSAQSITADVVNKYLYASMANLTINDGANTPEFYGIDMNMTAGTQTAVDGTIIYGARFLMPDISAYASGAGLQITENTTDSIVELVNKGNNAIKVYGANVEARDWMLIQPSTSTIVDSNTISYFKIDASNLTINDGANSPVIYGIHEYLSGIVATAVDGTSLYAHRIDMPSAGDYNAEYGLYVDSVKSNSDQDAQMGLFYRSLSGAISADRTANGYVTKIQSVNGNSSAGDFDLSDTADTSGGLDIEFSQTAVTTVGAKTDPDNFRGTGLKINVAGTTNNANTKLDMTARALDIAWTATETLGTLRMGATDVARIVMTIPDGLTSAGAFQFDAFEINADAVVLNDANLTHNGIFLDYSATTLTAFAGFYAEQISVPTLTGTSAAMHIIENTNDRIVDIIDSTDHIYLRGDTIESGNWLYIRPSASTINAGNTINYIQINNQDVIFDDGATTPTVRGTYTYFAEATATGVDGTTIIGNSMVMPTSGAYLAEIGLSIADDKTNAANNAQSIVTSKDIVGALTADRAMTNYSIAHSVNNINTTAGDFDLSFASGLMSLTMSQTCSTAVDKTHPDSFTATALLIDIDATTNTSANAELDASPRAVDITYTLTETLGVLRMAATDVARITMTIPDGLTSAGAFQFDAFEINADAVVLNDVNITHNGIFLDYSATTLTAFTAFYGQQISVPTLTGTSAGLHVIENTDDRIVDLIDSTHSILLSGDTIETSNWFEIKPSAATLNAANTINFMILDTDNWIINDGVTAPTVRGLYMNLDDMTETAVDGTTLLGIRLDIPNITTYAAGSAGLSVNNAAGGKFEVLPQTGQVCYITPSGNVDALEIDLTSDAWTSASAIDINVGDWIGGSNIIDLSATQASTVATNAAMQKIDMGTNITFTDGGAATQSFYGLSVDASAITAAHANFLNLRGINIVMPAAAHAAWGGNKTSAIHATGNGNTFDALLGDGIQLTMTEAASIGLDVISDASNLDNAMQAIVTSRDITGALTADRAMTVYAIDHKIENVNTTAGDFDLTFATGGVMSLKMSQTCSTAVDKTDPDSFAGTGLLIDVDAITNTNANAELDVTARALDIQYTLTETLGVLRLGTTDEVRIAATIPDGITSAGAYTFNMFNINGDAVVLNDANVTFNGAIIDLSGLTNTSSAALTGLTVTMPAATNTAITTNGEIVAGNLASTQYMPFEYMEPSSEVTVTITTEYNATIGGVANTKGLVTKVLATAGAPDTCILNFQYQVPADYKTSLNLADIACNIGGFNAAGGAGVIGTVATSVFKEGDGAALNTTTAAQNITGGDAALQWTTLADLAAGVDDISGASLTPGTKVIIQFTISLTTAADYLVFSFPKYSYSRVA